MEKHANQQHPGQKPHNPGQKPNPHPGQKPHNPGQKPQWPTKNPRH